MDIEVGTGLSGASRHHRWLLTAAIALAMTGCVNPAFRESVGQFGTLTKATVTAQNDRLNAVTASEQERIRDDLAQRRAELRLSSDCGYLVADSTAETTPARPPACRLTEAGVPIPQPVRYENILALSNALANYGESLVALAADSAADQTAFSGALGGLATSIGGLDGAIRKATGEPEGHLAGTLGPVATLLGEAGNLYFAQQRNRALRRIIREADPFVQRAVALLTGADASIELYDRNSLFQRLKTAERRVATLANARRRTPAATMRAAQNELFERLTAYNAYGAGIRRFQAIGAAHARLVEASRANASPAELRQAFEAIIHLFNTANDTVTALGNDRSTGNAN